MRWSKSGKKRFLLIQSNQDHWVHKEMLYQYLNSMRKLMRKRIKLLFQYFPQVYLEKGLILFTVDCLLYHSQFIHNWNVDKCTNKTKFIPELTRANLGKPDRIETWESYSITVVWCSCWRRAGARSFTRYSAS